MLLTDGRNMIGPSPVDAAQEAARHDIRIYTIGIGTQQGAPPESFAYADELDEDLLHQIADITHAQYWHATDGEILTAIYRNLDLHLTETRVPAEMAPAFTAVAMVLLLVGTTLSMRWFGGLP